MKVLAEGGYQVEALARCYFPDGIYVKTAGDESLFEATKRQLQKACVTLFEAEIAYQGYLVRTDILIKQHNHLKLLEIKAKSIGIDELKTLESKKGAISTKWRPYLADVAFQKWVLKQAFPEYTISSHLMLLDKDSRCPTEGLHRKFLLIRDKSGKPEVKQVQPLTEEDLSVRLLKEVNVDDLTDAIWSECAAGRPFSERFDEFSRDYFAGLKTPPVPKKACGKCQFKTQAEEEAQGLLSGFKTCWQEALGYSDRDFLEATVLELWNYRGKEKCLQKGVIKLKDLREEDFSGCDDGRPGLSAKKRQWLQIEKAKNQDNTPWIDSDNLRDEMKSWVYPLHFIDFETAMLAIPFKKGARPYQCFAFQFSHHIMDEEGRVSHVGDYLNATPGIDPSLDFIRALKSELENDCGTVFRYSNHENSYLNNILSELSNALETPHDLGELAAFIQSITKSSAKSKTHWVGSRCMVDLCDLVKRYYYDPLTHGSNSIKHVLPAILNRSTFLQQQYSQPVYGSPGGILSRNFINRQWIVYDQGLIKDPYLLLEPLNKEAPNEDIEWLFENEHLKEGGAAMIAYAKLQFTEMSDFERRALEKALLKYCELDTLAMVMLVEGWRDLVL
ncbi:DUF2779 domain-containing protein [Legionella erythra]|uniref:DUF2779 domain-containing protein n=1 Tax=Legionella erythra TaxID=448 RepID=UPI001ED9AE4B|nr:DUF2779 domain-containing protein [Legionella erythra]